VSAIYGLLRFDGRSVTDRDLSLLSRPIAHRGPDGGAVWRTDSVGIGHLLNRITFEDDYDAQPMRDYASGVVMAADLRLDNRENLADSLTLDAAALSRLPDSALLLRAYLKWGEGFAEHLLGDFVCAIWDGRSQKLMLARDHLGQRSVAYMRNENYFVFASEPRAIAAYADVPPQLDMTRYGARLLFDRSLRRSDSDATGIASLEAGSLMVVNAAGESSVRRYWTPQPAPEHLDRDEAYYVAAYRRVLGEAVACRVRRARRSPGLLLGGGFDSGAIAGLACRALAEQGRKLVAVSSVMPEGASMPGDARPWVERLAHHIPNLDVRYITREGADIFTGLTNDFVEGGGSGSPSRFANRLLYEQLKAAGVGVVMDGNAGDYTLNPRRHRALLLFLLSGRWRLFQREFRAHRAATGIPYSKLVLRELVHPLMPRMLRQPVDRVRRGLAPFGPAVPLARGFLAELRAAGLGRAVRGPSLRTRRAAMQSVLERTQLATSIGGTGRAAVNGMELTLPYLDKRVVELALAIPDELMFKNGRDRYLARRALADVLPAEFRTRGSANDELVPDFAAMITRAKPQILAELDRMEGEGRMGRYFDLPRIRRMLLARDTPIRRGRTRDALEHAARALLHARYIEWFTRDNAPGSGLR